MRAALNKDGHGGPGALESARYQNTKTPHHSSSMNRRNKRTNTQMQVGAHTHTHTHSKPLPLLPHPQCSPEYRSVFTADTRDAVEKLELDGGKTAKKGN